MSKSKSKPTKGQVKSEIEKLEAMKPNVRRESSFGDNHHDAIDAQIEVLRDDLSEDEIYAKGPDTEEDEGEWADNVRDAAIEARRWMDGESEDGAPSEEWKSLVKK